MNSVAHAACAAPRRWAAFALLLLAYDTPVAIRKGLAADFNSTIFTLHNETVLGRLFAIFRMANGAKLPRSHENAAFPPIRSSPMRLTCQRRTQMAVAYVVPCCTCNALQISADTFERGARSETISNASGWRGKFSVETVVRKRRHGIATDSAPMLFDVLSKCSI